MGRQTTNIDEKPVNVLQLELLMGFTMGLNLLLLVAMVATNILSLYHLSTNLGSQTLASPHQSPDPLLRQLHAIRATINHLNGRHPATPAPSSFSSDLVAYSRLSPIASACHRYASDMQRYMKYTPFSLCPPDAALAESLILRGCHPLPRRRCFSRTLPSSPTPLPRDPFLDFRRDSSVAWSQYPCKSFSCLVRENPDSGFDPSGEISKFMTYKSELDLPVPQLFLIAASAGLPIRLGIDVGGGTGSFAARMKLHNVTVLTTTMNLNLPNNEVVALRGLVPLHVPLQQRFPVFDGVVDLVRCGHAVNRWIPLRMMEFLFFDVDRVLRSGGYFWLDHFSSTSGDLEKIYEPLIGKLGYRKVKWAIAIKTGSAGSSSKHGEVYLTALLQKPMPRS